MGVELVTERTEKTPSLTERDSELIENSPTLNPSGRSSKCQRAQLRVEVEDRLRSAEAQPPTDGLLQRDQVAIPTLSRRVLVLSDYALA